VYAKENKKGTVKGILSKIKFKFFLFSINSFIIFKSFVSVNTLDTSEKVRKSAKTFIAKRINP
jgi:hypothetical protein